MIVREFAESHAIVRQHVRLIRPFPMSTNAEEFFFETLRVAAQAASAHEKTKLITTYPSQPWRSAVVAAYVTCPDDMAREIAMAFNESVVYVFLRYSQQVVDAKAN